jgi:hypothetical protein
MPRVIGERSPDTRIFDVIFVVVILPQLYGRSTAARNRTRMAVLLGCLIPDQKGTDNPSRVEIVFWLLPLEPVSPMFTVARALLAAAHRPYSDC